MSAFACSLDARVNRTTLPRQHGLVYAPRPVSAPDDAIRPNYAHDGTTWSIKDDSWALRRASGTVLWQIPGAMPDGDGHR